MNTTPTDTPETDALRESYVHLGPNWLAFEVFAKASERLELRAIAAEARVEELEAELVRCNKARGANIQRLRHKEEDLEDALLRFEEAEAALRLRPIAKAGPVPEGAVRMFVKWTEEGYVINPIHGATHFIDIYPPQP